MSYHWKDYRFDPDGTLLTKAGRQIDLSRKVLDCIVCLIEQRNRVVPYQELMHRLWGHDNVTNHQLTQIVAAARRALGDDGHAQMVIRNMSGIGYRWVQPVVEGAQADSLPFDSRSIDGGSVEGGSVDSGSVDSRLADGASMGDSTIDRSALDRPQPTGPDAASVGSRPDAEPHAALDASTAASRRPSGGGAMRFVLSRRPRRTELALLLALLAVVATRHVSFERDSAAVLDDDVASLSAPEPVPAVLVVPDTIDGLREAMRMGRYELVRRGLSSLPPEIAATADARMLQIEMEIEQGRFEDAERKLAVELNSAESAADPLSRANWLILQSESRADDALDAALVLPPAEDAVALLESAGKPVPAGTMGRALSARGNGFLIRNDLDRAIADLASARDMLRKAGDERRAAKAQRYLAHAWLREGRMTDALEQIVAAAEVFERLQDPVNEIGARNMATRIQVEQLRWDDALASSERSLRLSEKYAIAARSRGPLLLRGFVLTHLGRLREARYFFDEAYAIDGPESPAFLATHALAAGRLDDVMRDAMIGFEDYGPESGLNLNLESREGSLLLWTIAAQGLVERGESMPTPTAGQMAMLERPGTDIARIARGRWLWSQGQLEAAEHEFRRALENPSAAGRLFEILLAKDALIQMLLARGDTAAAERALTEMWGRDPDRFGQDYRANLLALRIALASGDEAAIAAAHRRTLALAGERALPVGVLKAYAQRTSRAAGEAGARMASADSAY